MSIEVVVLNCRGCSAALSIPPDLEQIVCSYCGTAQIVRRAGGDTHLDRHAEPVKEGTIRIATEVEPPAGAIVETRHRPFHLESQGDIIRLDRERQTLRDRLERGRLGAFGWAALALAISAGVGMLAHQDQRIGALGFAGAVGVVLLVRESARARLRRRIGDIDAEIARLDHD